MFKGVTKKQISKREIEILLNALDKKTQLYPGVNNLSDDTLYIKLKENRFYNSTKGIKYAKV